MIHGRPSDFGGSHAQGTVVINDRSWALIEPLLPGTIRDRGVTARTTGYFWKRCCGKYVLAGPSRRRCAYLPGNAWRDLPCGFGEWNSVFRRFRQWAQNGVFQRIFEAIAGDPDFEYVLIDGTIVSVHQKAATLKGDS